MTYFRELNWIFPVKEKSIFKLTVSSREKDIGSVVVDLNLLKTIPFDPQGLREVKLDYALCCAVLKQLKAKLLCA